MRIYQTAPPIPERVVDDRRPRGDRPRRDPRGQNVWQSLGGMEIGSIWGHGSYVAPDWTADWLHREAVFILDCAGRAPAEFATLAPGAAGRARRAGCEQLMRRNTYDPATRTLTSIPSAPRRSTANLAHYADVFGDGTRGLRDPRGHARRIRERLRQLSAFFFWTSWAASTQPSGDDRHLHEQLAARAAGRQPSDRRRGRLDGRQHHHAARRHRRDGVVVRRATREQGPPSAPPAERSAARRVADAVAARDRQVLLGRLRR